MTELSQPWGGTATGDAGPYTDDEWSDMYHALLVRQRTDQGVIAAIDHPTYSTFLAVTNPAGTTLRVAAGAALVDGTYYTSDANEDTVMASPGAGTDYYRLVLQKGWAAQTVRQVLNGPVNGGPAPALTQNDGVTWEIPLAEVQLTNLGAMTITDQRIFAMSPLATFLKIDEYESTTRPVTFASIPQCFKHLKLVGQLRSSGAGATIRFQFNGDTGNNYDSLHSDETETDTLTTLESIAGAYISATSLGSGAPASTFHIFEVIIPFYAETTAHKTLILNGTAKTANTTGNLIAQQTAGWWRSTAAITQVVIDSSTVGAWASGSIVSLYGIL